MTSNAKRDLRDFYLVMMGVAIGVGLTSFQNFLNAILYRPLFFPFYVNPSIYYEYVVTEAILFVSFIGITYLIVHRLPNLGSKDNA